MRNLSGFDFNQCNFVEFRQREFAAARSSFARFLDFYPTDYLAKMYFDRAVEYEQTPPDEYKRSTFYGRRVDGMASLMIEKGIIDEKELAARTQKILAAGTRDHVG